MITFIMWILFGAIVGWLASLVMARDAQQGTLGNIIVGILGATIGGFLFSRDVAPSVFSLGSLLTAFVGAVVLLAIVNLVQRGRVR
ncbi:MAG: GlsB/YeaQ/YmgE family stress response membrane protein [Polyangiaceae bacterium]|nr:GlsB/YeaQ/YmgE family stress response membrane protein [Polyangiaceae bacterium]